MKRIVPLLLICAGGRAVAGPTYLGLYLKGNKIGYSCYESTTAKLNGTLLNRSDSKTVIDAGILGSSMSVTMNSTAWTNRSGRPIQMKFDSSSDGRVNRVLAVFHPTAVNLELSNGSVKSHRVLALPSGGDVVDDPLSLVLSGGMKAGTTQTFYVLDPSTASFMRNIVHYVGSARVSVLGKSVSSRLVRIQDSTSTTDVYINGKGDVLKVDAPMGIVMLPVTKTVALAKATKNSLATDLAEASSIKPDRPIEDPDELSHLKLKLACASVSEIPSDGYQSVTRLAGDWIVDIHPPKLRETQGYSIVDAGRSKPLWVEPSLNVPSDSKRFRELAARIIGSKKDVRSASFAIQMYVYQNMKFNSGIGVLRDASEILDTKDGVCRDFAVLTLTLLRAAGIPARLATGLVNADGAFYYHAWTEAWDGARWFGVDSVTDRAQLSASHVKLGEGNIDTAFTFAFLEKAKITILDAQRD